MDLAVIGTKYVKLGLADDLDESEEINACSINVTAEIDGKRRLAGHVQNETHNHPTEIRPFGGAATCLGGRSAIARAYLCVPNVSVTGCADERVSQIRWRENFLSGKSPPERRTATVPYGNQIGIATGRSRRSV